LSGAVVGGCRRAKARSLRAFEGRDAGRLLHRVLRGNTSLGTCGGLGSRRFASPVHRRTGPPDLRTLSALRCPVLDASHGERAPAPYRPRARGRGLGLRTPDGGLAVGNFWPSARTRRPPGSPPPTAEAPPAARGGLVHRPARVRGGRRRRSPATRAVRGRDCGREPRGSRNESYREGTPRKPWTGPPKSPPRGSLSGTSLPRALAVRDMDLAEGLPVLEVGVEGASR
jgi:hypothetical protein